MTNNKSNHILLTNKQLIGLIGILLTVICSLGGVVWAQQNATDTRQDSVISTKADKELIEQQNKIMEKQEDLSRSQLEFQKEMKKAQEKIIEQQAQMIKQNQERIMMMERILMERFLSPNNSNM